MWSDLTWSKVTMGRSDRIPLKRLRNQLELWKICAQFDLLDAWRVLNPDTRRYTCETFYKHLYSSNNGTQNEWTNDVFFGSQTDRFWWLPAEFYKVFWNDIADLYLKSINQTYRTGQLSVTQRRGIIKLIPKKDAEPYLIKNWRPISLLNCDYIK